MKKKAVKIISAVMAILLLVSVLASSIFARAASPFKDLSESHWAYDVINGMYGLGFIQGDNNGNVNPDANVKTVELMAIINRMFGLKMEGTREFADVAGNWGVAEKVFSYADAQGYLIVEDGNKIQPNAYLTREKAFALIGRYLGITSSRNGQFTDEDQINTEYAPYIFALVEAGIVEGYPDGSLKPQKYLRRSEAMKILYYMVGGNIINKNASKVSDTGISASTIVAAITDGVILSNSTLKGDVYISEGATGETVKLVGCDIACLIVRASNCDLVLSDTSIQELVIDSSASGNVTVNASGSTKVSETQVNVSATLTDETVKGGAFESVISETNSKLTIGGISFPKVQILTAKARLVMSDEKVAIGELTVGAEAEDVTITGSGTIQSAYIQSAGVQSAVVPVLYTVADGLTAKFNDKEYSGNNREPVKPAALDAEDTIIEAESSTLGESKKLIVRTTVQTDGAGTVYLAVYDEDTARPGVGGILVLADSVSGKKIDVKGDVSYSMDLAIDVKEDKQYEAAILFVPTNAKVADCVPVYGPVLCGQKIYPCKGLDYTTGFEVAPEITEYTAPDAETDGSLTIGLRTVLAGTVYVYPYTDSVAPDAAEIKAKGKAIAIKADEKGTFAGENTFVLTKGETYRGIAALFVVEDDLYDAEPVYQKTLSKGATLSTEVPEAADTGFNVGYPKIVSVSDEQTTIAVSTENVGRIYVAVVKKQYNPTANIIRSLCTGADIGDQSLVYTTASYAVTSANAERKIAIGIPKDKAADYKLVCVLADKECRPMAITLAEGETGKAYTSTAPTLTVSYAPEQNPDALISATALELAWDQQMFILEEKSGELTKSALTEANVGSLFKVYTQKDKVWEALDEKLYTVVLTANDAKGTVVTVKPGDEQYWSKGTLKIVVDEALLNDNLVNVLENSGEATEVVFTIAYGASLPTVSVDKDSAGFVLAEDTLYFGDESVVKLVLTGAEGEDCYYSYNSADYDAEELAGTKVTETFAPSADKEVLYFWAVKDGEKSPLGQMELVKLDKPVIAEADNSVWSADSYITATRTQTVGELVVMAKLDDTALDEVKVEKEQKLYLAGDGSKLVTTADAELAEALSGRKLTIQVKVIVDDVVIAVSEEKVYTIGYLQGTENAPILLVNDLDKEGKWQYNSSVSFRKDVYEPSDKEVKLYIWADEENKLEAEENVKYYLSEDGTLTTEAPDGKTDFKMGDDKRVTVHVAYMKGDEVYNGLETVYTIGVNGFVAYAAPVEEEEKPVEEPKEEEPEKEAEEESKEEPKEEEKE